MKVIHSCIIFLLAKFVKIQILAYWISMTINRVDKSNFDKWSQMCHELWSNHVTDELDEELNDIFEAANQEQFLILKGGEFVGLINLSLRNDYVEGADETPTAYIEGIYIRKEYRNQGCGTQLIEFAKEWAKKNNCVQLASDTELSNKESQKFHIKSGFKEVSRSVHYIKLLK